MRWGMLKTNFIVVGAFCLLLWFLLPTTPVLSTFGYPTTEGNIQSASRLLKYLQDYNKAIVRTTQVVHWFIFVFVWWFLTSYFDFSKAITAERKNGASSTEHLVDNGERNLGSAGD
jgi:hypothetical protein